MIDAGLRGTAALPTFVARERSHRMGPSLASRILAANSTLIADGNLDAVREFFTSDYVAHGTDQDMAGHGAILSFLGMVQRAFPDLQSEVEILVEGKDRVAWQRTLRGKQQGDFMGFPASGRQVVWRDMVTSRFRDGLIAEDWVITDLAERLLLARKRQ
jgi:predicted ester cyclase